MVNSFVNSYQAFLLLYIEEEAVESNFCENSNGYKTIYACEGKVLHIVCKEGNIHLIRANFGRFSISICNDHGNLDWRVNCMSHHSFLIMQERCSLKPNCSVNVSSTTFDDPCPGTLKYLEVQYHCGTGRPLLTTPVTISPPSSKITHPTTNVTSIPIGKILTPTHQPSLSSTKPTLPNIIRTTTVLFNFSMPATYSYNKTEVLNEFSTTEKSMIVSPTKEPIKIIITLPEQSLPPSTTTFQVEGYCVPTFSRGINWPSTKDGETAIVKCPDGASGTARWRCKYDHWSPEYPNLLHCHSLWLENLKARLQKGDSIISVISELSVISSAKPLYSNDLKIISELTEQALYKSLNSMANFLDTWHRYHVLKELLQSSVITLNNMLDIKQETAWKDLQLFEKKKIISTFFERLDNSALLLAETSNDDSSFNLVKSNVWLSLEVLKSKDQNFLKFPSFTEIATEDDAIYWLTMEDSLVLPQETIENFSKNGLYKVVFSVFNKLNNHLKPSLSISHHPHGIPSQNVSRIINSRIIGASFDRSGFIKLNQPVVITLKHLIEENVTNPLCVYWDFHLRAVSGEPPAIESPDSFEKQVNAAMESSKLDERMQALSQQVKEMRIRRDSDKQDSILSSSAESDSESESSKPYTTSYDSLETWNEKEKGWSQNMSESQTKEWILKSLTTLKSRKQMSSLECSLDSCISHFTKPELLTGNNKFRCENCSKIKRKKTGDKKAAVYSNASKQLLIFSPPAILTLHLKRFQQVGMSLRKVNRFVEFPLYLDIASYCSSACLILPHMSAVQDEILYSLYGIVEHSGHLRSGHYTAYVKAQKRTINKTFISKLPLAQWDLEQLLHKFSNLNLSSEEKTQRLDSSEEVRWYYISDNHVKEVSEAQVLKCQAYLLFYERIK